MTLSKLDAAENAKPVPNPSNGGGNLMDLSKASSARGPLTVEEKKHRLM